MTESRIPERFDVLRDSTGVLQHIIKNYVLSYRARRAGPGVRMSDLIKQCREETPECLDLNRGENQEEFHRVQSQCTKFMGKKCRRIAK